MVHNLRAGSLCDFRENFWQRKRHPARRMDRGKLNGTFIDIILTRLVDLKCHTDQAMTSIQNGRHRLSIYRKLTFQVKKLGKNKAFVTLENDHLMKHFKLLIRFMSFLLLLFWLFAYFRERVQKERVVVLNKKWSNSCHWWRLNSYP